MSYSYVCYCWSGELVCVVKALQHIYAVRSNYNRSPVIIVNTHFKTPVIQSNGCIVLYCTVLYCIVLYCIVLYCIVLYCIVLYCIVLYSVCMSKKYTVSKYRLSVFMSQIQRRITAVTLFPTLGMGSIQYRFIR
jgi:uncharacterized membrane protein